MGQSAGDRGDGGAFFGDGVVSTSPTTDSLWRAGSSTRLMPTSMTIAPSRM